ncbi:zinc finger Y-chromosomal protein-like [Arctopsyche grandis]|uniref:zinc finger Y-chromosomal protein-like n=1 Tax=Arctopsyche grandis TaxID=121162 RepID=UPI00406DA487
MINQHVCRVCLRVGTLGVALDEGRRKRMLAIISNRHERKRITRCTSKDDYLPSWVCSECDRRLPSAAAFVALCRRSERRLHRAQRLQIPFDTLHQQYKTNRSSAVLQSIKKVPFNSPIPSPIETDHWDDNCKTVCEDIPSPIDIKNEVKIENELKIIKVLKCKKDKCKPNCPKSINKDKNSVGRPSKCNECKVCGKFFRGTYVFRAHRRMHREERAYKCPHCKAAFMTNTALTSHIDRIHVNPPREMSFICHLCGKVFPKRSSLQAHMQSHNTEMRYQCQICKRRFRLGSTFIAHKLVHTGERRFPCSKCDKRFGSSSHRRRHMSVHAEECTFKCETCGKMLKSKITLKQHIENVHKWEKSHVCDVCDASLSTKENLKQHFRAIHSDEPGLCKICNEQVSNLREHKRSHTSEMLFHCHLCPKRFGHKRSLTAHVKRHEDSGSSKFVCDVNDCNKTFKMQCLLDFHFAKYHNEHTPYVCQYCSKGFYTLPDMTKHLKNAHFKKYSVSSTEDDIETYS